MLQLQDLTIRVPVAATATATAEYLLDDTFFNLFEGSLLHRGRLVAYVQLTKTLHDIELRFLIEGVVELNCDRTWEPFDYAIHVNHTVHFKLGHQYEELDVDLYMIDQQAGHIALAQHMYDFITLAIPLKRLHPQLDAQADYRVEL